MGGQPAAAPLHWRILWVNGCLLSAARLAAAAPPRLAVAGLGGVAAAAAALAAGGGPPPGLLIAGSPFISTACDIALSVYVIAHWTGVVAAALLTWLAVSAPAWLRMR